MMLNEKLDRIKKALELLRAVAEEATTPKAVKRILKESVETLQNEKLSPGVRAANVVSALEEVVQDPNLPSFSRVQIWSAVSQLEAIRD
jgi:uncharacterized protein (UPF0147 family)